jgi:hypothetical protein
LDVEIDVQLLDVDLLEYEDLRLKEVSMERQNEVQHPVDFVDLAFLNFQFHSRKHFQQNRDHHVVLPLSLAMEDYHLLIVNVVCKLHFHQHI